MKKILTLFFYSFFLICVIPVQGSNSVKIRFIEENDLEQIHKGLNDIRVVSSLPMIPYPLSISDVENWYKKTKIKMSNEISFPFVIVSSDFEEDIIRKESKISLEAEIGYWLRYDCWGKGYITDAISQIVRYGFTEISVNKILGYCLEDNIGSIRALEKNYFKNIGKVEQFMPARNRTGLFVIMSLSKLL